MQQTADENLPSSVRSYWMVSAVVSWSLLAGAVVAASLIWHWPLPWWLPVAVLAGVLGFEAALLWVRYRNYSYRISGLEFRISRGRIIRRQITAAVPQILHTVISQGPVQRRYGLVTFKAQQAAGVVELGPVLPEEAERLRQLILEATSSKPEL